MSDYRPICPECGDTEQTYTDRDGISHCQRKDCAATWRSTQPLRDSTAKQTAVEWLQGCPDTPRWAVEKQHARDLLELVEVAKEISRRGGTEYKAKELATALAKVEGKP